MAKPLGGGLVRSLTVKRGKQMVAVTVRLRLFATHLGVVTAPAQYAGEIALPFWGTTLYHRTRRSGTPDYLLLPSVYTAFRQTVHTLFSYGARTQRGEKLRIADADAAARAVQLTFLSLEPGVSAQEVARALSTSVAYLERLFGGRLRSTTKRAGERQLRAIAQATDSLGRVNPSVGMTRALTLQRLLTERLQGEILHIEPAIAARQRVLLGLIHYAQDRLADLETWVAPYASQERLPLLFDRNGPKRLALECSQQIERLGEIDYHPFRWMCEESIHDLTKVKALLRKAGPMNAARAQEVLWCLSAVHSANAIKRQQIAIERLLFQIERDEQLHRSTSVRTMQSRLQTINQALDGIDESTLRTPVCTKARGYLTQSLQALEVVGAPNLHLVRSGLKSASRVL